MNYAAKRALFPLACLGRLVRQVLIDLCPHPRLRANLLWLFGATVGRGVRVERVTFNPSSCFRLRNLRLEDGAYVGPGTILDLSYPLEVGARATIGPGCILTTHSDCGTCNGNALVAKFPPRLARTRIGASAWLGAGVVVLCGVQVGDMTVIGAASLVNKDVPANSLAYGNPARVVKEIG